MVLRAQEFPHVLRRRCVVDIAECMQRGLFPRELLGAALDRGHESGEAGVVQGRQVVRFEGEDW